jgi:putative endonuclease
MFYVYILYSKSDDLFYVGHTNDVSRRLLEHNNAVEGKKYASKHCPWDLVFSLEISESRSDAIRMERFIKKQKNKEFLLRLIAQKDNKEYINSLFEHVLKKAVRAIPRPRD